MTVLLILKSKTQNPKGGRKSPGKGRCMYMHMHAHTQTLLHWITGHHYFTYLGEVFDVFSGTELDPQVSFTIQSNSAWHFCEHCIITVFSSLVILSSLVNVSLC